MIQSIDLRTKNGVISSSFNPENIISCPEFPLVARIVLVEFTPKKIAPQLGGREVKLIFSISQLIRKIIKFYRHFFMI
jgi:hypothetical protein